MWMFVLVVFCSAPFVMNDRYSDEGVIPDVISSAPKGDLKIKYGQKTVSFGNELTPDETRSVPSKIDWKSEESSLYTIVMTDPDAPSRANHKFREWRHWLVVNVPGPRQIASGVTLTKYNGPGPPKGTGLHRYVFLVYLQNNLIVDSDCTDENRPLWSVRKFVEKHRLGDPIAGNFFQAKNAVQ